MGKWKRFQRSYSLVNEGESYATVRPLNEHEWGVFIGEEGYLVRTEKSLRRAKKVAGSLEALILPRVEVNKVLQYIGQNAQEVEVRGKVFKLQYHGKKLLISVGNLEASIIGRSERWHKWVIYCGGSRLLGGILPYLHSTISAVFLYLQEPNLTTLLESDPID
jgi:hypothetical protein